AVWLGLGLSVLGCVELALVAGVAVLFTVALATGVRISLAMVGCCVLGALVGWLRLWDGAAMLDEVRPSVVDVRGHEVAPAAPLGFLIAQTPLAVAFVVALATGKGLQGNLRRTGSYAVTGAAMVGAYLVLSRGLGETV